MNIYAARNNGSHGSATEIRMGGFHSAGVVVAAESRDDAQRILLTHILMRESKWDRESREKSDKPDESWMPEVYGVELVDTGKAGVVLYAEGEC